MNNSFVGTRDNLVVANRDPEGTRDAHLPFWINFTTKELFHYTRSGWVSLTKENIKIHQPERPNPTAQCRHELEEYEGSLFCDKCKMP